MYNNVFWSTFAGPVKVMIKLGTVMEKMPWFIILLMGGGRALGDICLVRSYICSVSRLFCFIYYFRYLWILLILLYIVYASVYNILKYGFTHGTLKQNGMVRGSPILDRLPWPCADAVRVR